MFSERCKGEERGAAPISGLFGHVWLYKNANEMRLFTGGIGDLHVTFSRRDATLYKRTELSYDARVSDLSLFFCFGFFPRALRLHCGITRRDRDPRRSRVSERKANAKFFGSFRPRPFGNYTRREREMLAGSLSR